MIIFSSSKYFEQIYTSLSKAGFKIEFLVTESPKPAGRGRKITKNPAHQISENIGLKTLTLSNLNEDVKSRIGNQELGVVFSYGKIIPRKIIDNFKHGIINIHPSLLPKYRGPTPIQTALLNGDRKTGYTIIKISDKCDAGEILYQEEVEIIPEDDSQTLLGKVMSAATNSIPQIIKNYLLGKIKPKKQNESKAVYTKKFTKSDGQITSRDSAQSAFNKIRAFSLWPKAYLIVGGKRIILHKADIKNNKLFLREVQLQGKNRISFEDFKRGYAFLLTKFPNFVRITEE